MIGATRAKARGPSPHRPSPDGSGEPRWIDVLAASLWSVVFLVLTGLALAEAIPTYAYDVYTRAAADLFAGEPLYRGPAERGFQYLPSSAVWFALATLGPAANPSWLGPVLWRLIGLGTYASGVVLLARDLAPATPRRGVLVASLLAVGPAVGPLGNGQANLLIAGLALHGARALGREWWWSGAALLSLAVAVKPVALPHLALATAVAPALWWRIPLMLVLVLVAPVLAVADTPYLARELPELARKLSEATNPRETYENVQGLVATVFAIDLSGPVARGLQLVGAAAALLASAVVWNRRAEPLRSVLVGAVAASWVVLLSPQTQPTYFVIPAGFAGVLAAAVLGAGHRLAVLSWAAAVLTWTVSGRVVPWVDPWLAPLGALGFTGLLLRAGLAKTDAHPDRSPSP